MTSPNELKVVCLKLTEWPSQDQHAWAAALCEDDLVDDPGLLTHLRPSTIGKLRGAYGRWLWFLSTTGQLHEGTKPSARITREAIGQYLQDLRSRNASVTVAQRILDLERVALAFAPDGDWHWLRRRVNKLFLRAQPTRGKRGRMRPASEMFATALVMLVEAETEVFSSPKKQAAAFRDALILAILASRAPRVANLAMIEIDRHLCRAGRGWTLRFEGSETKNGDPLELPLPEELWLPLERYLAHWRLVLLHGRTSAHLWISAYGQPIGSDGMHFIVTRTTRKHLKVSINPHLFRSALATEIAIRDPAHAPLATPLLGHRANKSRETYNLARQHEAVHQWQQLVLGLRCAAHRR